MVLEDPRSGSSISSGDTTTRVHPNRKAGHPALDVPPPQEPPPEAGTLLGRYIVIDRLGSGGSGAVYRAYDPRLDRRVAVKVLHTDGKMVETDRRREFLLREGQAMARLSHPNVVPVHDVGPHGDDLFVAMELVEGTSLSQWLSVRGRPWKEVRAVFLRAGAGLAAAHRAGLVHRDFKPGNVLLEFDGAQRVRRVLVADFGLARSAESSAVRIARGRVPDDSSEAHLLTSPLTQHGLVKGTPGYMAPELLEGERVTAATDQFAFCVALWRALYGEWPYTPAQRRSGGGDRSLQQPSHPTTVPRWLHAVLERGLSLDADDRFPSMDVLLQRMKRDLRSRRRIWLGIAIAGALSLGSAAAGAVFFRPPPSAAALDEVDQLTLEARAIAARAYFVYPDPDDPTRATAYSKVLALERLDDANERGAIGAAADLRDEFARTLVRLGDEFFDRDGGRPFAADYYAAALVFVPDLERARSRTTLTPGEVADLRDRSTHGEWSPAELTAGASLAALAAEDPQERIARLRKLHERSGPVAASTAARMRPLLSEDERSALDAPAPGTSAPTEPPSPEVERAEPEAPEEPSTGDPTPEAGGSKDASEAARSATKAGLAALREHRFDDAQRLLAKAVALDRRNARALAGLAELHFERGSYRKAVSFGERAVQRSPRAARYHILLGDAYFKTLAFNASRREYERAHELGHRKAQTRLKQLRSEMGN